MASSFTSIVTLRNGRYNRFPANAVYYPLKPIIEIIWILYCREIWNRQMKQMMSIFIVKSSSFLVHSCTSSKKRNIDVIHSPFFQKNPLCGYSWKFHGPLRFLLSELLFLVLMSAALPHFFPVANFLRTDAKTLEFSKTRGKLKALQKIQWNQQTKKKMK